LASALRASMRLKVGISRLRRSGTGVATVYVSAPVQPGMNRSKMFTSILPSIVLNVTEAIKAATVNAADLLGLTSEIGTLEAGKRADLIAVTGGPLKDVTVLKKVEFVMKDGQVQ
jgi:imidazolonepropionase-like amidohydrolase